MEYEDLETRIYCYDVLDRIKDFTECKESDYSENEDGFSVICYDTENWGFSKNVHLLLHFDYETCIITLNVKDDIDYDKTYIIKSPYEKILVRKVLNIGKKFK